MQQDYYLTLARVVMASAQNSPQLRKTIYDLARQKLQRQVDWEGKEFYDADRSQRLLALEAAIEQIEADLAQGRLRQTNFVDGDRAPLAPGTIEIIPPSRFNDLPRQLEATLTPPHSAPRSFGVRFILPFIGVAILAVGAYSAFQRDVREIPGLDGNTQTNIASRAAPSGQSDLPTPGTYGVYAVADGQLAELEPLPIRVPDGRLAVSPPITTPSTAKLATGQPQFIVFKRDLVNSVPEKVVVRAVAHLNSGPTLGSADATSSYTTGDAWAIRGASYDMRVAPVSGNPAMIVIRAADASFSFPAGRYALVLKGVAYDFSVEPDLTKP